MDASRFIARRLRFGGKIAMASIAISFFIIIIAVSISSGFRTEIRNGISKLTGDIQLMPADMNYVSEDSPISSHPAFLGAIDSLQGVKSVAPAVYRAGIIKKEDNIHGVVFKGVQRDPSDTSRLNVLIPDRLSNLLGIEVGDKMLAYFVGENIKVRNFTVSGTYESIMDGTDNMVILADIKDMQRLNGWGEDEVSDLEITLTQAYKNASVMEDMTRHIGMLAMAGTDPDEAGMVATSVMSRYPQIFDWLNLIDFNVLFILILMTIVAGFNMISGLLIMLFRNISTIGTLKSMGMTDGSIAKIFLRVASEVVFKGMLIGNLVALAFCAIQGFTHFIKLNPENYFVSFVPVSVNLTGILLADAVSYLVIMLLLFIPCLFISRVDPAQTVRAQ
jgi:lipoprotein-releasing system permease protein